MAAYYVKMYRPGDGPFNLTIQKWLEDHLEENTWDIPHYGRDHTVFSFSRFEDMVYFKLAFEPCELGADFFGHDFVPRTELLEGYRP